MPPFLTKSRFKAAYKCPAKLLYLDRPKEYANTNDDNEFLIALAKGGFQVGALAKLYYPGGIDLEELGAEDAITRTRELLRQENVTIFEAALQVDRYLVRVDVLVKKGKQVSLIEVKSKSIDSKDHSGFFKTRGAGLQSEWEPYLVDVAFQTWVAGLALPDCEIFPSLLLADKSKCTSVDGLHQHFRLTTYNGPRSPRAKVIVNPNASKESLGQEILADIPVQKEVNYLIGQHDFPGGLKLHEFGAQLADFQLRETKGTAQLGGLCKTCEFRVPQFQKQLPTTESTAAGQKKNGFNECWQEARLLKNTDISRPLVFDIWNFRKSESLIADHKVFMTDLCEEDFKPSTIKKSKSRNSDEDAAKPAKRLEAWQRQWLQVSKQIKHDPKPYIDLDGLRDLFATVVFPLHCIDFETTTMAIPFHKGRRPYEQIAFQFSHHILHQDGRVEHADQHLDMRLGVFPNFDFVRKLKESLSKNQGTIFRFAPHENTVLRQIRSQLTATPQKDQEDLIAFIDQITKPTDDKDGEPGPRNMQDLRLWVLDCFYHPLMGGSNSIKKVIPAVLQESQVLREKYQTPVHSLNFGTAQNREPKIWIEVDAQGNVKDPYKKLPPVFSDISQTYFDQKAALFDDEFIDDGGAAMTAWARMQFTEMSSVERQAIESALLKYCELDTLSMIWILEYWRDLVAQAYGAEAAGYRRSKVA